VHIEAAHLLDARGDYFCSRPPGDLRGGQLQPDRVKQERARAACWVEHPLGQRIGQCPSRDFGRQPIRRVVFAKIVPLGGIDQALVKRLQYVDLHVAQAKAPRLPRNAADQIAAVLGFEYPVEEIALDGPLDADLVKCSTGEDRTSVLGRKVEHARRDCLGDDRQISMLQEQRVVADLGVAGGSSGQW
jgi:hypothetical protein